ncbi:MAG: GGDEF domain-containing protein [Gemmiger sp.]|nr:GGDEF domain-containing protein [Gemmiger sp.]
MMSESIPYTKFKLLWNAGMTPTLRDTHQDTMRLANQRMLRLMSLFIGIVCGGLVLFVVVFDTKAHTLPLPTFLYLLGTLVCYSLAPQQGSPPSRRSTVLLFVSISFSYLFAILSELLFYPGHDPLLFCVLLAIFPTFVSAPFWQSILPATLAEVLFLLLAFATETWEVFCYSALWTLCCLAIGIILGHHHVTSKVREYLLSDQLCRQRDTDSLTNLMTRGAAESQIRALLAMGDAPGTMMILDIDNFKSMNDTYGHSYGDAVLECIAQLLQRQFRTTDYVCRLGGDEFMVFVRGNAEPEHALRKARNLLQALADTPTPGGKNLHPTISVGIALFPQHGTAFEELYRRADNALYKAKHSGKNTCQLFNA